MNDESIIKLYMERDEAAILRTQEAYGAELLRTALHVTGSRPDAEECVNTALYSAWESIPPAPKCLPAYLTKLVRNAAVDALREKNAEKRGGGELPLILDELSEAVPDTALRDPGDELALKELLNSFISALPEEDRRLFLRRYFYSCPVAELARMHGISRAAVKMRLSRIRKKLKDHLEKEGIRV